MHDIRDVDHSVEVFLDLELKRAAVLQLTNRLRLKTDTGYNMGWIQPDHRSQFYNFGRNIHIIA